MQPRVLLHERTVSDFRSLVWDFYHGHKRDLAWRTPQLQPDRRGYLDLYPVFISEVMLQQTQVPRVEKKYTEFLAAFPTVEQLAKSDLIDVLRVWQGMGYNRRGKYLWQAAQTIVQAGADHVWTIAELDELPGIGPATAASIYCFTYDRPVLFIETNIRRVHIHHFFTDKVDIPDAEVIEIVRMTLDTSSPREWYYALMDYGSYLASIVENPNKRSKHYTRQSRFEGSDRQIRGRLLKAIINNETLQIQDDREQRIYDQLVKEGMITLNN